MVRYICVLLVIILLHKVQNTSQLSLRKFTYSLPMPAANDATTTRRKRSAMPSLPAPHQLLFPNKLHVLPARSNMHQSSVHTDLKIVTKDNVKIPVISQTVTHHGTNITHPSRPLVHLLPTRDLTVIPLKVSPKLSLRMDLPDDEPVNRFRTFYGGYGAGLLFGGHGAGHGFYAYG